ncbi:hypothetical protein BJY52DRAFT_1248575 [Lactarius psammicola]|nr:hypothetical protein BJY52DRAFT_1248575 [Lactarius psammicola]
MRLESQLLFTACMLKQMAADELVALENMNVLQQSGYEVALEEDQPVGRRLRLMVQPMRKNTKFDLRG